MKKIIVCLIWVSVFAVSSLSFAASENKLVVLLDWFPNPNHAPLFVAQEKGFFKKENLDVTLIGPADPSDPPKLVAAKKADIAITYQPQFMEQIDRGLPLICIGTLIDRPLNVLVTLQENHIEKIEDLRMKRIGHSSGGMTGLTLKTMLATHHVPVNEVQRINVKYDLSQALLSKKVDAITGMMRNFELIQLELAGHPAKAFYPEEHGIPTYSELIFVINKDFKNDPRFKKFMVALQQGIDYLQKNPDECWALFVKSHPALNDELNKRAWKQTLPLFAKNPREINSQKWLFFAEFMKKNGLIFSVKKIDEYMKL